MTTSGIELEIFRLVEYTFTHEHTRQKYSWTKRQTDRLRGEQNVIMPMRLYILQIPKNKAK
jgi:hypothetical protein